LEQSKLKKKVSAHKRNVPLDLCRPMVKRASEDLVSSTTIRVENAFRYDLVTTL